MRLTTIRLFTAAALCAPATACATPRTDTSADTSMAAVTVTTDRSSYSSGASVGLRLRNQSDRQFGYNACTRRVEREAGAGWEAIPEADRVCTMELRLLEPQAERAETTELPQGLTPGRYRLLLSMSDETDASAPAPPPRRAILVATPVFSVQ